MMFNDARRALAAGLPLPAHLASLAPFASLPADKTYTNRDLDKALAAAGSDLYARSVGPSEAFSKNIGNSYTGALWCNLASIVDAQGAGLAGKRLGMFSYGSGALATMFAVDAAPGAGPEIAKMAAAMDVRGRLAARHEASPYEFLGALDAREHSFGKAGWKPAGSVDHVPAGGWYLKEVKADHSRVYDRRA